jgi:dTDP-4-dehydrorhamnose reductase
MEKRTLMPPTIKTAVIGASGYVGRFLWQSYQSVFPGAVGTSFSCKEPGLARFDIRNPLLAPLRLEESGHAAVLICSARPNIDFCQREPTAAMAVNVTGTLELVRQIAATSMQVIFISSDYVFDGERGGYTEASAPAPTTEYGRQKALVEKEISSLTDNYLILRLSKIFGVRRGDGTLLDDLASNLTEGKKVRVARDQFFCPTYVGDLVRAVHSIQSRGLCGLVNLCSPEVWSRHEIALAMCSGLSANRELVTAINLHDIAAMAGRPLNTSMRCSPQLVEAGFQFTPLMRCFERVIANYRG